VPTKKVRIETGRPGKADAVVYGAEWEAGLSLLGFFLSVEEAQRAANYLAARSWWKRNCKVARIIVSYKPTYGLSTSLVNPEDPKEGLIVLRLGRLCEGFLYHEAAHLWVRDGSDDGAMHGPTFIWSYVQLVGHIGYRPQLRAYRASLAKAGIVIPRKRP